jgi:hypothetical protein
MQLPVDLRSGRIRVALVAAALVLALGAAVVLVVRAGTNRPAVQASPSGPRELAGRVEALLATHRADQPYRDPSADERAAGAGAFDRLLNGDRAGFAALGFSAIEDVDSATGRRYALLAGPTDERAWGAVLVDLSEPVRLAVEVPHPRTDIRTEWIGLDVFRQVPGSVMLIAGAHRRAAGEQADVAHNADSMFQVFSIELAKRGVPQVQLHGYADLNLPDANVVVSTGSGEPNPLASRIADELRDADLSTCRAWARRCGRLEGTTNVQGHAAAEYGATFVHVEMSNSVRVDADRRTALVSAIAAAV